MAPLVHRIVQRFLEREASSDPSDPVFGSLLNKYVRGSHLLSSSERRELSLYVVRSQLPHGMTLERIEPKLPDWRVGDRVQFDLLSFTSISVSQGNAAGDIAWKSSDKALTLIEHAKRGLKIDYDLINVSFDASNEKEVLISGAYKVKEIRNITEPGTFEPYGYKTPAFILTEA